MFILGSIIREIASLAIMRVTVETRRRKTYLAFFPVICTHCPFHHGRKDSQNTLKMRQYLRVWRTVMKLHLVPQDQNNSQNWTLNQTNSQNCILNQTNSQDWILNQTNSPNWILNQSNSQSGKKTKIRVGPSVFVIHQKCLHIIHWDSQPSVVSRLVQTLYLDDAIHFSSRPGCYLRISIIHHTVMGLWCIPPICR